VPVTSVNPAAATTPGAKVSAQAAPANKEPKQTLAKDCLGERAELPAGHKDAGRFGSEGKPTGKTYIHAEGRSTPRMAGARATGVATSQDKVDQVATGLTSELVNRRDVYGPP
jgi:hypothetical protein